MSRIPRSGLWPRRFKLKSNPRHGIGTLLKKISGLETSERPPQDDGASLRQGERAAMHVETLPSVEAITETLRRKISSIEDTLTRVDRAIQDRRQAHLRRDAALKVGVYLEKLRY